MPEQLNFIYIVMGLISERNQTHFIQSEPVYCDYYIMAQTNHCKSKLIVSGSNPTICTLNFRVFVPLCSCKDQLCMPTEFPESFKKIHITPVHAWCRNLLLTTNNKTCMIVNKHAYQIKTVCYMHGLFWFLFEFLSATFISFTL